MVNRAVKAASGGENVFKNQKILLFFFTLCNSCYNVLFIYSNVLFDNQFASNLTPMGGGMGGKWLFLIEEVWHFTLVSNANCGECHVTAETHRSQSLSCP